MCVKFKPANENSPVLFSEDKCFIQEFKKRVLQICKKLLEHIFLTYGLAIDKKTFFSSLS